MTSSETTIITNTELHEAEAHEEVHHGPHIPLIQGEQVW